MAERNGGTAVCPGSYDPVTFGHIDIITRASRVFDTVVVGVVNKPVRKQKTLFDAAERVGFIEAETAKLGNVQVNPLIRCSSISPASTAQTPSSRGCGRSRTSSTSSR